MGRPRTGHQAGFCKDHFRTQAEIRPSHRMDVSRSFQEPEAARRRRPLPPQHYLVFPPAVARRFAGIVLLRGGSHCSEYSGNKLWVTGSLIHMCYRRARVVSRRLPLIQEATFGFFNARPREVLNSISSTRNTNSFCKSATM